MKVFVRTASLQSDDPDIIAVYGPAVEIEPDAHGPGVSMIDVPPKFVASEPPHGGGAVMGMPRLKLKSGWRSSGNFMRAEAQRRIGESFGEVDQIAALRELLEMVISYGHDESQWPSAAQERRAKISKEFKYVENVDARARSISASEVAINPASDSSWPQK